MTYANTTNSVAGSTFDRVRGLVAALRARLNQRRIYTQTLYELRALSDRDLSDLGISRHSIAEVAREAAYGL